MRGTPFTGEFLVPGDPRFAVDLVQHMVPYLFCAERVAGERVLEMGCGAGYGAHHLAGLAAEVHAYDRSPRAIGWARANYAAANLSYRLEGRDPDPEGGAYGAVCTFQVLEHLRRPGRFLRRLAACLRPGGMLYLTTPNRLTSLGENIYHVREYSPEKLDPLLRRHFSEVTLLGVTGNERFRAYRERRRRAMQRFLRLDPLRLRRLVPRPLLAGLYPVLARAVRRGIAGDRPAAAGIEPTDFRVHAERLEAADDLLAICRRG